jgi:hypothetical protein
MRNEDNTKVRLQRAFRAGEKPLHVQLVSKRCHAASHGPVSVRCVSLHHQGICTHARLLSVVVQVLPKSREAALPASTTSPRERVAAHRGERGTHHKYRQGGVHRQEAHTPLNQGRQALPPPPPSSTPAPNPNPAKLYVCSSTTSWLHCPQAFTHMHRLRSNWGLFGD